MKFPVDWRSISIPIWMLLDQELCNPRDADTAVLAGVLLLLSGLSGCDNEKTPHRSTF
jgi:hypothetical protein